jgi:hypothetical protein
MQESLAFRIFVERREGNRPLGTLKLWWEDNIRMNKEIGWGRRLVSSASE